jgi:hypothetical protein
MVLGRRSFGIITTMMSGKCVAILCHLTRPQSAYVLINVPDQAESSKIDYMVIRNSHTLLVFTAIN